jgi:hypothetical protein
MRLPLKTAHYDVDLNIEPAEVYPTHSLYGGEVSAQAVLLLESRGLEPLETVRFVLYRLLQVKEVSWNGAAVEYGSRLSDVDGVPRKQVRVVDLRLPSALAPGGAARLQVRYEGPVCGYHEVYPYVRDHVARDYTLLRRDDVLYLPVVTEPSAAGLRWSFQDTFTFRLRAEVEPDLVVASAGRMTRGEDRGRAVYTWESSIPDWRLDVAVARFGILRAQAGPLTIFYLPGDEVGARVMLRVCETALRWGGNWFAPVSRPLNIIAIPEGYGSQAARGHILQERSGFGLKPGEDPEQAYHRLIGPLSHECLHLWSVASREPIPSRFLDEGITHYLETVVARMEGGERWAEARLKRYRGLFLSAGDEAKRTPLAAAGSSPACPAISRGAGPWFMAVLEALIGLDGVLALLRDFYLRYHHTGATLLDWCQCVREHAVPSFDVEQLLGEWFNTAGAWECLEASDCPAAIAARYRKQ